jgi:hypothetical protein
MPTENDPKAAPAAPTAPAPDRRDQEIASLKKQVEELEKKLKAKPPAASAPSGDYCVLGGKTYQVDRLVPARFATDEGRKGHLELDSDLVVLKR